MVNKEFGFESHSQQETCKIYLSFSVTKVWAKTFEWRMERSYSNKTSSNNMPWWRSWTQIERRLATCVTFNNSFSHEMQKMRFQLQVKVRFFVPDLNAFVVRCNVWTLHERFPAARRWIRAIRVTSRSRTELCPKPQRSHRPLQKLRGFSDLSGHN